MESLSETEWDVIISGTGLQQSLLALALSRSNKKVLHVDENDYYGGAEAAFSLQEAQEWVNKVNSDSLKGPFLNASIWKAEDNEDTTDDSEKLSFSRAYTLALGPQIIYSRSKLISQLVSSKIYKQLEFQAVGNWWIYSAGPSTDTPGTLKKIPNGREDVFSDSGIDVRAKRSLMKFLKFVVDYENQTEIWEPHAESPLQEFLAISFSLPPSLVTVIIALTFSLNEHAKITVRYALPRIARHLTSTGVFGPGFGAVISKWGGASEIAQVACRAGAVGGGVYMLGTGVKGIAPTSNSQITLTLANDVVVRTKSLVKARDDSLQDSGRMAKVSKMISVVSSDLPSLFMATVEGAPPPAVSVVAFSPFSIHVDGLPQSHPVYMMVHSSDTGECPTGQCILYTTTLTSGKAKARLEAAISAFITSYASGGYLHHEKSSEKAQRPPKILYNIYYEQSAGEPSNLRSQNIFSLASSSTELAFDDVTLENIVGAWRLVMEHDLEDRTLGTDEVASYMAFAEREQITGQDDDYDGA